MHHPDPAGKMPHPAVFHRRGSNTSGGGAAAANPALLNNSHVSSDDYQPSVLIQHPAASSSPGPHHPPPQSLNLQPPQPTGAQIKKKSGFQITSVTPAQISVSTNNSIAEDTESYDDLDESHTEDLSSSEILDVSLSRANDMVGAERSSSEETLNNFHEAETPGAISPNQPSQPHTLAPAQQRGGAASAIMNGTMHHHQPHHLNHVQSYPLTAGLPSLAQNMPSNVGGPQENVPHAAPGSVASQPAGNVSPGTVAGMHSSATATAVSVVNPQTSSVSNVNVLSSANVPVRGGIGAGATGSSGGGAVGGGGVAAVGGGHVSSANVNMMQQPSISSAAATPVAAVGGSAGVGVPGAIQGRAGSAVSGPVAAGPSAVPAPAPAVTAATSRFRVVKLDSSSEPFKKGRWTCAEFYDKDTPTPASSAAAAEAASVGSRQFVTENFTGVSERESTSGSSVSTLSHYVENLGSGEAGSSPGPQHTQDYASPPQGFQGIISSGLSMGAPQSQAHIHTHDINHPHVMNTAAAPAPTNIQQTATGAVPPQQLTYAQAVVNQPPGVSQGLGGVQQPKMGYAGLPQQSAASPPAPPASVRPTDYSQPPQGLQQAAPSQPLPSHAGSVPSGLANGAAQMMGGSQQPQALVHKQAAAPGMPPHAGVPGLGQQPHADIQQQKPQSLLTQMLNAGSNTQHPPATHQSQAATSSVPPPGDQAHNASSAGRISSQDPGGVQALVHAAQANALYASLPTFTTTQLQDAQRLLLQHQSLLKLSGVETRSNTGMGQEAEGNSITASALTAPAGLKTVDGEDDGSSGASVVAIDNKIEQAMDLVKSHLMYAVREEVEVLKEQIKELIERNSQLEQENTLLKTLASPEQMAQFQAQVQTGSPPAPSTGAATGPPGAPAATQLVSHGSGPSA